MILDVFSNLSDSVILSLISRLMGDEKQQMCLSNLGLFQGCHEGGEMGQGLRGAVWDLCPWTRP